ncbi:MAG: glutamate--cysteine ligase [Actinomycetota bacterium]|nr:glutamate--cysteine ligase [Actinomycetota bacterium]
MTTPTVPTVGVEEEFLLLDPASGRPVPAAPEVLRRTGQSRGLQQELMRYQIEAVTAVCTGLSEVRDQLWTMRNRLSGAAAREGCRLVASGVSPYTNPGLAWVTDDPRYRELARRFPVQTALSGTCACHVHVAVPSRDEGVRVLAGIRPWLASLLALSVNSPISEGRPSGWHSRRYTMVSRWPTGRPPGRWRDARHYEDVVQALIRQGAAMDERSVYFFARLSPRYPTVELRVADVCPDVDTAVLLAGLFRALVTTVLRSPPITSCRTTHVRGSLTAAARSGLGGRGFVAGSEPVAEQDAQVERLMAYTRDALDESGDRDMVGRCLALLVERGTGAERQLRQWEIDGSPATFTQALARATLTVPAGGARSWPVHRAAPTRQRRSRAVHRS